LENCHNFLSNPDIFSEDQKMTDQEFEEIFNRYKQDVMAIAFYYLRHIQDAEDVTMEVFADFYHKPPKDLQNPKPILLRMAVNKAMDVFRKAKNPDLSFDEEIMSKHEGNEDCLSQEEIAKAITQLPAKLSAAITLVYLSQLTSEEAATALQCSPASLRKRLERGKKKLKEVLKAYVE
jgi:RNA polymerase sigma factor (sigma-70 family)